MALAVAFSESAPPIPNGRPAWHTARLGSNIGALSANWNPRRETALRPISHVQSNPRHQRPHLQCFPSHMPPFLVNRITGSTNGPSCSRSAQRRSCALRPGKISGRRQKQLPPQVSKICSRPERRQNPGVQVGGTDWANLSSSIAWLQAGP